jgi:lipopolysaccharide biosynthesis protein
MKLSRKSRFFANIRAALRHPLSRSGRRAWRESMKARNFSLNGLSVAQRDSIDARLYNAYVGNSLGRYPASDYVSRSLPSPRKASNDVKFIAYYLPQFHPIPENDKWWGKGFTEWRNVARAFPVFDGHYQPRIPGEFGYYDLRIVDQMRRQIELATEYGVSAFCFHFYWFGGKTLLEQPLLNVLENKDLTISFSLCWANENWSRRWDGGDDSLLIRQQHSPKDDVEFIRYIQKYFRDERYMKVDGKPVLTVYRPEVLPDARATIARWRDEAIRLGFPGLYLIATNSFNFVDYRRHGFDALSEFPPHQLQLHFLEESFRTSSERTGGSIYSYAKVVEYELSKRPPKGVVHPGVMPGWDNSARRPNDAIIYYGETPALFRRWLDRAVERASNNPAGERFVFINAWNEWAEGAYLEPDARYGYAWLQMLRQSNAGQ